MESSTLVWALLNLLVLASLALERVVARLALARIVDGYIGCIVIKPGGSRCVAQAATDRWRRGSRISPGDGEAGGAQLECVSC